ncbi:hypothetical protein MNBD_GAMMA12-24 [hydrothermal vent metagenome]|uniref:Lipoprotein n=1 Tax=hydrothermal vent metagenome TaxID=652676 RepID=A0A3B0Y4D2_9ZZZZ
MRRILAILVLSAFATGCVKEQSYAERLSNNKNPMTALHADATSTRYEAEYWKKQKLLNSKTWVNAIAFCKWHDDYTNCYAVNEVYGPHTELKSIAKKLNKSKPVSKEDAKEAQSWTEVESRQKKADELAVQKDKKEALNGSNDANNTEISEEEKAKLAKIQSEQSRIKKLSKVKKKTSKSQRAKRKRKKKRARRKHKKSKTAKKA